MKNLVVYLQFPGTCQEALNFYKESLSGEIVSMETMQNSSTKELIFGVDELIAHLSQLFALQPGDLIFTGTPPGVGAARKPPVYIKPGDRMEVEIEGLGILANPVAADSV